MPAFSQSQLHFFEKFAEALFDGFDDMAISLEQITRNFSKNLELAGDPGLTTMRIVLTGAPLILGLGFTTWSVADRRASIQRNLIDTQSNFRQDLARLKSLVYAAYYGHWVGTTEADNVGHNEVFKQLKFQLPMERYRAPEEARLERLSDRDIDPRYVLEPFEAPDEVDYIVIGSGPGGAVAARNLAPFGSVLIIEAGPFVPSNRITLEERRMGTTLFKNGALQSTWDSDIIIFQGRNVGGSSTINNGICLRMAGETLHNASTADPFDKWIAQGADIGRANLVAAYDAVGTYLGVSKVSPRHGIGNGQHLLDGWKAFAQGRRDPWITGANPGWYDKNFGPTDGPDACARAGYCNTGCPYARKRAMGQSYLPDVCKDHGARILPDTKVERIEWDKGAFWGSEPWKATGVIAIVGADKTEKLIRATKGVVVAGGTIASSKLLERSGIENTGHGISLNVASPVVALMPEGVSPAWDEDQMTSAVDCGDFWLESHFQPPMSMSMLMGGWFEELDRRMKNYSRMRSVGVLLPLDRRGKVVGDKLSFKFRPEDLTLMRKALATLSKIHRDNGALEIWPSLRRGLTLAGNSTDAQIDAFYSENVRETDDLTLSSAHPHGGNPINADPDKGVVDLRCKVHGTTNVLVTDASVFPTCIGVNAQYTVMAISHYATAPDPVTNKPPI